VLVLPPNYFDVVLKIILHYQVVEHENIWITSQFQNQYKKFKLKVFVRSINYK